MISIIICSASPDRLKAIEQNISTTIDTLHEFIAIDNRELKWPIAKVYNYAAQKARYPYLFFVHEDIKFHSEKWGIFIENKLKETDCGAIGFAGCSIRFPIYSGWDQYWKYSTTYYYQRNKNNSSYLSANNVYLNTPFREVVTLDGMGFFVRKELWEKYPFDENLLSGFHCYDIDFTLQLAQKGYKNYVSCSNLLLVEHFSHGKYNDDWYSSTITMHRKKWNKMLPLISTDISITKTEQRRIEEKSAFHFLKNLLKTSCTEKKTILKEFWLMPFSFSHFIHCINCTYNYIKTTRMKNSTINK